MHTLYVVATPIGNLEDITLRALRILHEVRLIAAEDTRTTRKLLDRYQIATPLTAYHEHNKLEKLDAIFGALADGDVALVSDAGTPGISDPGYELIGEAIARGVTVVPIPGPNALVAALVGSGLPTDGFVYLGFLPRKASALRAALQTLAAERRTLIAYESPNRLVETLEAVLETLGSRPVVVARELTKIHEEFVRGTAKTVCDHFREIEPRGEITLLVGGVPDQPAESWDDERVRAALRVHLADGLSRRDAARLVAQHSGRERRSVYDLSLDL